MTTTDTTALQERINDAFLSEEPWRAAVEAVMRHEGYTDEEIAEAYGPVVHTDECTDNGYPFGYDCTDEEGQDQHPLHTRSQELADTYRLFFEESPLAAAVLPIVEAEVRKAKAEALRDAARGYGPAQISGLFLGADGYTKAWLTRRADQIEK